MDVILREDVGPLGHKGDVVNVSDGYARNYLVPKGLAMAANPGAVRQAGDMQRARQQRDTREREAAELLARKLSAARLRVKAKAGIDGKLFGSITAADVARAAEKQTNEELDKRRIHIPDTIKSVGLHEVTVRPHPEVEFKLTIEVVAET
ncbi:MAG: 50S ribosomal protein L9 [Actinobacteria bacterium ATB1]|nr:50S ribosomal protein L9 [Actinobacteria bacterium ATB1]